MQARLVQTTDMPPGHAELHLNRLDAIGEGIEICLALPSAGKQMHLDPRDETKPWGSAEFWFAPPVLRREGDGAVLGLDPATTFHLRANQPYILSLRDAAGRAAKAPLLGIALRVPSTPPKGWGMAAPAAPVAEPPPPPPEPVAAPAAPAPELVVEARQPASAPAPAVEKKAGAPIGPILGLFVLLALIGGGAWWWFNRPAPQQAEAPATPAAPPSAATPARDLEAARKALAGDPAADAALALGKEHLAARDLDGAFLLFRAAGEKGNAEAAIIVGGFYDPASWTKETSPLPAPNADQAANWYRRAAEAGNAEAQYRLGMVLKSGKTEATDGPEQAVGWLRKAAEQGHAKAKEALGQ